MIVLKIFAASFIVALSGALMPGPLLTVTIIQTARRGFLASALIVAGHALLELILVTGLVFGLGSILEKKLVMGIVACVGGIMLLWMGWGMIRDARRGLLDQDVSGDGLPAANSDASRGGPISKLVLSGAVVSLSNPYWVLWWATIGLAGLTCFRVLMRNPVAAISAFYVGHIMGDILWYLAIGGAVVTGRKLLSTKIYGLVVQVCGVFLIFLGFSFLQLLVSGKLWAIKMSMDWMRR